MVFWQRFEASEWQITYAADELDSHGVSEWEAEESNLQRLPGSQSMASIATSYLDVRMQAEHRF